MREFPNLIRQTKPFIDSGSLSVVTVSADTPDTLPELKRVIRKLNVEFPVIYDGGIHSVTDSDYSIPIQEWNVNGLPSSFLINPQGEIVANALRGENLGVMLEYYINENPPLMGLNSRAVLNDDGSISIFVNAMNRSREDVLVTLNTYQVHLWWDKDNIVYDDKYIYADDAVDSAVISFDKFSEATHEFILPYNENLHYLMPFLYMTFPQQKIDGIMNSMEIQLKSECSHVMPFEVELYEDTYRLID